MEIARIKIRTETQMGLAAFYQFKKTIYITEFKWQQDKPSYFSYNT